MRCLLLTLAGLFLANTLQSENIVGSILIKRKLTKRSVTASASVYQRGPDVELGKDAEEDPLSFERERVAVWVEGPGPSERTSASIQQTGRRFAPDMVVVPAGSVIAFPNMDPIFHNVFSLSRTQTLDLGNYPKGESRSVTFSKPGIVHLNCHLHPNMAAVIVVTPNRWGAKADSSGRFELRDLPPGTYTIVAWHKAAGFFRKTLTVQSGSDSRIEFFIPLDALPSDKLAMSR